MSNAPKKTVPDISKIRASKIKIKFDIRMLESIIGFIYKDSVLRTSKVLKHILSLFEIIDEMTYVNDVKINARVWVIKKSVYARIVDGFDNDSVIITKLLDDPQCDEEMQYVLENIDTYRQITYDESKYIVKAIDDRLRYGYIMTVKEIFNDLLEKFDDNEYKSYKAVADDLYQLATSLVNIQRQTNDLQSEQTFSLMDEKFEEAVTEAVNALKDRNKIFITGIQRLNTILSPGYMSKRLYTYLAFPGGGKSQILLKSALDIKKYNPNIKPKDPSKTPAILFITMENNIQETVERLYNMTVANDDIRNYTPKQVIKKLRQEGQLTLTEENNIDIVIQYHANRSISTDDLYTLIQDLNDSGSECVCLILDYLKRIRPAEKASDEKGELKNITNELKSLATNLDIPVITAQQLNRSSAAVVDAALQAKKEDITKLVGRDGVGSAWEIVENSDWLCIVNKEVKTDTGELYLTFKMLKRRYRSAEEDEKLRRLDYFNHPYEPGNEIRLIDDIDMDKPLSCISLASQFAAVEDTKRGKKNAVERKDIKDKKKDEDPFGSFEFDKLIN